MRRRLRRSVAPPPTRSLLTVSARLDPDRDRAVAGGRRPRPDHDVLAEHLDADLLDVTTARAAAGPLIRRLGDDVTLAWVCFRRRHRYRAVVTDSEAVGLPFAALGRLSRRPTPHVMIGHRLSTPSKVAVHRLLGPWRRVDRLVVYCSAQRAAARRLGYRDDQIALEAFMVDTDFWREDAVTRRRRSRPLVVTAGQERRDFATFVDAVRGLDADVVVAADSPWAKGPDAAADLDVPDHVTVTKLDPVKLRHRYADAAVVVVPLLPVDFQAGITTILEAMAMSRPVVVTATPGQLDTIADDVTGVYVPPGDAEALTATLKRLVADPARRRRLGAAARTWVVEHADVEGYAARLARVTDDAVAAHRGVTT